MLYRFFHGTPLLNRVALGPDHHGRANGALHFLPYIIFLPKASYFFITPAVGSDNRM
jgi:hypothetical protein